ncbi:hypothetical protein NA56DRAFT_646222 [Hyaloscypha hepaticicola]|uniref:Uncharacterized protein n=1 Tax=Hyaloscypha hepaticicola TaxID=2082293 RepID=A0A2J6Q2T6_9HELO|nr:hypothetical protein NA56DRAFT_646222 [Hyaloscypha hepaticicola]
MASRRAGLSNAISAWDTAQPEMASRSTPFSLRLEFWRALGGTATPNPIPGVYEYRNNIRASSY